MRYILEDDGLKLFKESLSAKDICDIKRELTVKPFKFGFKPAEPQDDEFTVFQETDDFFIVPKFWALDKFPVISFDMPVNLTRMDNCDFKGELRPYQQDIIDTILPNIQNKGGGVLSVVCGAGKTCMAIYTICQLKVKTLIVVNKTQLLLQWKESIHKFMGEDTPIGTIQQDVIDIEDKPIVIGMLQSLSMREYEENIFKEFDYLIVDEVHNIATKTFSKMLQKLSTPYTLGLSATPQRPDGMSKVFHWFLGPMLFRQTAQQAALAGTQTVSVHIYKFNDPRERRFKEIKTKDGQVLLSMMLTNISEIDKRNVQITGILQDIIRTSPSRYVLILSSRVKQLETLKELFDKDKPSSVTTSLYIGAMKEKKLQDTLQKKTQVLFATFELVQEGFDYPELNTLIFATPRSRIEQAVGRILRKYNPDLPPLIVDVVDELPSFKSQGDKRRRFYNSLKYSITNH